MASAQTIEAVKQDIRISHNKLDGDIGMAIDECLADLALCGVVADETDKTVFNAIRLWCRSFIQYTDDVMKSGHYMDRYNKLKSTLMTASDYQEAVDE